MGDRIYAATRKGLFTIDRSANGGGWQIANVDFLGVSVSMFLRDDRDGSLYAALNHGHFGTKLHRSADGGKNWEECAVPVYPDGASIGGHSFSDEDDPLNQPKPASLSEIWALETGGPAHPELLWAGTIPGGLFCSRDRGTSWELVDSLWDRPERLHWFGGGKDLPGIHSICVDPRDNNRVAVGVSCGGIWITEDGGATWNCRADGMRADYLPPDNATDPNLQDPHRLVQSPTNPDCYWVQHHNGIFRSTDNSSSWQELQNVPPSAFGFAVAVHPHDADTAWFVPALDDECRVPVDGAVVVTRTRDGGASFDVLSEGLPQQDAYDIVFRHGLDIDETGDRLVVGSSTGSLWVTENGGDTWVTVSTHLPQVYCVRFGK